jgi:large-conductance mechanosensitive channel
MKTDKLTFLYVGVALAFLSSGLRGFFSPDETKMLMQTSFLIRPLLSILPSLVTIVAIHDTIIAVFLLLRILPKYITAWVVIWMTIVLFVHLSTFSFTDLLDALEHSIILATAIFLCISAWKVQNNTNQKQTSMISLPTIPSSQQVNTSSLPTQ